MKKNEDKMHERAEKCRIDGKKPTPEQIKTIVRHLSDCHAITNFKKDLCHD